MIRQASASLFPGHHVQSVPYLKPMTLGFVSAQTQGRAALCTLGGTALPGYRHDMADMELRGQLAEVAVAWLHTKHSRRLVGGCSPKASLLSNADHCDR